MVAFIQPDGEPVLVTLVQPDTKPVLVAVLDHISLFGPHAFLSQLTGAFRSEPVSDRHLERAFS